jgi:hypothetical protein
VYEALSYSWDNQISQFPLWCYSHQLLITQNVHAALHQLRHEQSTRRLWIDQICINQADLRERHHQVCIMGEVYAIAEKVLVWLGSADEDTGGAWQLLNTFRTLRCLDDDRAKIHAHQIATGVVGTGSFLISDEDNIQTMTGRPLFEHFAEISSLSLLNLLG